MTITFTLAYFAKEFITTVKSFMMQAPALLYIAPDNLEIKGKCMIMLTILHVLNDIIPEALAQLVK